MGTKLNTVVETVSARGSTFVSKSAQVMRSIDSAMGAKSREMRGQILMLRATRRRRNRWLREVSAAGRAERERAVGTGAGGLDSMEDGGMVVVAAAVALEGVLVEAEEDEEGGDEALEVGWLHV